MSGQVTVTVTRLWARAEPLVAGTSQVVLVEPGDAQATSWTTV
jgi:hypothetical protein